MNAGASRVTGTTDARAMCYTRPSSRMRAVMSFFTRGLGSGLSIANRNAPFDVS
jgi:hypothetical protein